MGWLTSRAGKEGFIQSSLNEELSSMSAEASKTWATQVFKALKAKSAKKSGNEDSPVVRAKIHSKLHGGRSTNADALMDSGCTYPLTTMTVIIAIKVKVTPLYRELIIVEASGKNLEILGTVKFYLEADVLGNRRIVEAAVIRGEGTKEDSRDHEPAKESKPNISCQTFLVQGPKAR